MGFYFEDHLSMAAIAGSQVERTLDTVVRRFRGVNPPHTPIYRPYLRGGIMRGKDYRYEADFNKEFPKAKNGSFVYVWGRIWADAESQLMFDLSVHCPTVLWVNQQLVFRSTIFEERYPDERQNLKLPLQAGWNHVVLRFRKTDAGFGGIFGTWLGKLPYYFLLPLEGCLGQEGWAYTEPQVSELACVPGRDSTEASTGLNWQPRPRWSKAQLAQGQCRRIYGMETGASAISWTRAMLLQVDGSYTLSGKAFGPIAVIVNDEVVFEVRKAGAFNAKLQLPAGPQDIMVRSLCTEKDWGFELSLADKAGPVSFQSPCRLQGSDEPWIHAGPLSAEQAANPAELRNLNKLVRGLKGDTFWRLDSPELWVRTYNDNALYGRWNYPLGVTLYGLLHSSRLIESQETQDYIVAHMSFCSEVFEYALWDRKEYGGATNVHHLLTSIDSLDDCGSFGSSFLEVLKYFDIPGARAIADYVADFITNKQVRLADKTFFRKHLMHVFHEDTLWADDLYMSVPFLCRYYQLTGESRYVDDAARQFLGFKEKLYIPARKLMSHVYDFSRGMATGIPWGRGNGWVLFSLSELLAVLPEDHLLREDLLTMFRELCAGTLAQQDVQGMWHQVLDEHDSYPETSCTSMFSYAYARGIQYGWLSEPAPYVRAVYKAWEALNRVSIDRLGNVHGVCRGSEFSYSSDYYKKDLLWNLNDTHGIGIVLLAGVEVHRLTRFLQSAQEPAKPAVPAKKSKRR
jgi:rhamnogalacturonyl hydrolase YesR